MNLFRALNLQRALSVLILFSALFSQIQSLYACESMGGEPRHICCCGEHNSVDCPMADHCGMHENAVDTHCCEVSYEVVSDEMMMSGVSTLDFLLLTLDSPQPPPIIEFQKIPTPHSQTQLLLLLAAYESPPSKYGEYTYLMTRRLRI